MKTFPKQMSSIISSLINCNMELCCLPNKLLYNKFQASDVTHSLFQDEEDQEITKWWPFWNL